MLLWLLQRDQSDSHALRSFIDDMAGDISAAMLFLRQINSADWHDRRLAEGDDLEVLRLVDTNLHPAYLRLAEAVLAPLIKPAAHFARLDRGKRAEGLDVFNLAEELSGGPLAPCVTAYNHTVRNGIGHGGITYLETDIRYRDKKGNTETLDVRSVVQMCDDMIDTCNALVSAYKVFFALLLRDGYRVPEEQMIEELIEETRSPWWRIEGCLGSQLPHMSRLLVYARPNSRDPLKVMWSSVQTAALAESLAPGYDRYFLSLRSPKALAGWAGFDGAKLRQARESDVVGLHAYAASFDESGFFYVPRVRLPRLIAKLDTLAWSFRLQIPQAISERRRNLEVHDIKVRDAQMHRNGWRYVLSGSVVTRDVESTESADFVRRNRRRILRGVARQARKATPLWHFTRYLPLGYARVSVLTTDFRRRRLSGFGLGPELVCTVQRQRIRRIKAPDILGSTIEASGTWRIAWNQSWLESVGSRARTEAALASPTRELSGIGVPPP